MYGLDEPHIETLVRLAAATADEHNANPDGGAYERALGSFGDPEEVHRIACDTWQHVISEGDVSFPGPTWIAVHEAAGKTLDELCAAFTFDVLHEEDPRDPRPLVRVLRFPNLVQATEFLKLFDPGCHSDVWFTYPNEVNQPFDQRVCVSVTFTRARPPGIVHGEDDMRQVARDITRDASS
jgi:hypothetical protein